jgi:serine/threonine protein kinase/tetratricopeptide (TPR) repeat protein
MSQSQRLAARFVMGDLIGQGGMGTVYRGVDSTTGQAVAIKLLKPDLMVSDPSIVERFAREAEALRQLNHPNIVKVLGTVEENGQHYIIMEYITGGSLHDVLYPASKSMPISPLPLPQVLNIALDLADAITRAHRLDIIHRDLKPANVLIADDGTPRLTDFGVARFGAKEHVTDPNSTVGTLDYLPPEALRELPADARSDIWSFGVLLFEMLAGKRPFEAENAASVLMAILTEPPTDLEKLRPDCPTALVDLVYRMLEKDPDARIPSVRLVGAELEAILQGAAVDTSSIRTRQVVSFPPSDDDRFATPTPTASAPKHNLPIQATPFIGREHELTELSKLLAQPETRLVTIIAPGGMGKTRLSLAAAEHQLASFQNGVYFVALAPLSSAEFIVSTIAEAVGFQFYPGGEPKQQLLDFFREKSLLLVLDNFEHVLDGAAIVSDMLTYAPGLKILATSRERLNLGGEMLFTLSGMDFPDWETPQDALHYAAVKLFMQSAKRAQPGFELRDSDLIYLARICRLVAGMPLAIVLAAAWVEMLSLQEIAAEIDKSLAFLETERRDIPERQRSVLGVFAYAWNRLSEDEQSVFMKLSVFRGGFTREAAEKVAGANLRVLMGLVNKSLLRRNPNNGRYEIHELLRQYAEGQLERVNAVETARDIHSAYYADFLERHHGFMFRKEGDKILAEIEGELENIRAAWHWAVKRHQLVHIENMQDALEMTFELLTLFQEGFNLFQEAISELSPASDEQTNILAARLGLRLGWLAGRMGDYETMRASTEGSLPVLEQANLKFEMGMVIRNLGTAAMMQGQYDKAREYGEQQLRIARETGNTAVELLTVAGMSYGEFLRGNLEAAKQQYEAYMSQADSLGIPLIRAAYRLNLGEVLHAMSHHQEARQLFEESLAINKSLGNRRGMAYTLNNLGNVAHALSDYPAAQRYNQEALDGFREIGDRAGSADALNRLGGVARSMLNYDAAIDYHHQALAIYRAIGDLRGAANSLALLRSAYVSREQFEEAEAAVRECLALRRQLGNPNDIAEALQLLSHLIWLKGDLDEAIRVIEESLAVMRGAGVITPQAMGIYTQFRAIFAIEQGDYQLALNLLEPTVPQLEGSGARWALSQVKTTLAAAYIGLGRLDEAARDCHQALAIIQEIGARDWLALTMSHFGLLRVAQGQVEQGIEWAAAAQADQKSFPLIRPSMRRRLAQLEGLLPPDDFAAAVERGKALDLDTVMAQLLTELQD